MKRTWARAISLKVCPMPNAQSLTVLVVDPDKETRQIYRFLLESQGHQVVDAKNGQEALEQLTLLTCDIAVVDIRLPDEQTPTLDIIVAIRRKYPSIYIISTTTVDIPGSAEFAFGAGADEYCWKPLVWDALLYCVDGVVERRKKACDGERDFA